jgi:hypothetical protein
MYNRKEIFIRRLLLSLSFIIFTITFLNDIWDPDFFWHLKTGEYIFNNKSIPDKDIFSINPTQGSLRERFILSQYWLSQVIFYTIYLYSGFKGIVVFRALILTLTLLIIFLIMRREKVPLYISIPLIFLSYLIMREFTGERPQLFSFIFSGILIYILECHFCSPKKSHRWSYLILLPGIMLIWSNTHGGFILGDIIIGIYVLSQIVDYFIKREIALFFIIIGLISILASFINPNGYRVIDIIFELEKGYQVMDIIEYIPTLKFFRVSSPSFYGYAIPLLISIPILFKKFDIKDTLIILFLGVISIMHVRYTIFFSIIVTPILGRRINDVFKPRELKIADISIIILAIFFSGYFLYGKKINMDILREMYPTKSVEFIKKNNIKGNIFSPLEWGGFIIWSLYPENRVFIDGRIIDEMRYSDYQLVMEGSTFSQGNIPEWKSILDRYRVNIILTYSCNRFSGIVLPLIKNLMNDKDWGLIYTDENSLIFLKGVNSIPKSKIYDEIISECNIYLKIFSLNPNFYITMGNAYIKKGMNREGWNAYRKALKLK